MARFNELAGHVIGKLLCFRRRPLAKVVVYFALYSAVYVTVKNAGLGLFRFAFVSGSKALIECSSP